MYFIFNVSFSGQVYLTDSHGQSTHAHMHSHINTHTRTHARTRPRTHKLRVATLWRYPFVLSIVKFLPQCWFLLPRCWWNKGHHCVLLFKYSHSVDFYPHKADRIKAIIVFYCSSTPTVLIFTPTRLTE